MWASEANPSNPSLKRRANGRLPGPGWWYAVHFHQSDQSCRRRPLSSNVKFRLISMAILYFVNTIKYAHMG